MKNLKFNKLAQFSAIGFTAIGLSLGSAAFAGDMSSKDKHHETAQIEQSWDETQKEWSDSAKNAWRQGKVETVYLLNEHLNNFKIDTSVDKETITLKGMVETEVEKELAEELAYNVDGIKEVDNQLEVSKDAPKTTADKGDEDRSFTQAIKDASLTASVKAKLIQSEVKARNIDVDTYNAVVSLDGKVQSKAHIDLANEIAKNIDGVKDVKNELKVVDKLAAR